MEKFNFQVNLSGMIDILSHHLYSDEKVFIRELLQNATDAISARKLTGEVFTPNIEIELIDNEGFPKQIIVSENGIGLTEEEVHKFLSIIGMSSKKDELFQKRQEFIGQFGIGLLSCFMITDEIIMISRAAKGGKAVEWRGYADGTYAVKELEGEFAVGTKVFLKAKPSAERHFNEHSIEKLVKFYADLLPYPIYLVHNEASRQINTGNAPWTKSYDTPEAEKAALMQFGEQQLNTTFLDCIPLHSESGKVKGAAYIVRWEKNAGQKETHRVYLHNMLISESADNVLPEWAFFVKCVINAQNLRPTASRESFYEDQILEDTREELGKCIKDYLVNLEQNEPHTLEKIILIHYKAIKVMMLNDTDFFRLMYKYIPFETNVGRMTLDKFHENFGSIRYVTDLDEYRQVSSIAAAQSIHLVNAGYVYDREFMEKLASVAGHIPIVGVSAKEVTQQFEELTAQEELDAFDFIELADMALAQFQCTADLKKFEPKNVPTIYYRSDEMGFFRNVSFSKEKADDLWSGILDSFLAETMDNAMASLCFNFHNPLVKRLISMNDVEMKLLNVQILYVQALLLGHHPLQQKELDILTNGLLKLMEDKI
jgi:molecular chaperone HtpG